MLRLNAATYEALRTHGEETYPHECCGVLLGHSGESGNTVQAAVRAGNTRTDSAHNRYNIAPQELVKIQRRAREQGWDIVGFYHSHPDHPAQWSATDLAEAHWLGCSYVITAVAKGAAQQTNSFLLTGASEEEKALVNEGISIEDRDDATPHASAATVHEAQETLRSVPA
jgi:proteasome lid subunit RPN8/RPN11